MGSARRAPVDRPQHGSARFRYTSRSSPTATRGSRPSIEHREPLVREPLRLELQREHLLDDREVRTPVGVQQHRQRTIGFGTAGREERHAEFARTADEERRGREEHGGFGRGRDHANGRAVHEHAGGGQAGHCGRRQHRDVRADDSRMHPRLIGEPCQRAGGVDPPHVRLGGVLVRAEHDTLVDIEDLRHLQAGGRHGLVVKRQPLGVVDVHRAHQAAIGKPGRDADRDVEPPVVVVLADERDRAGARIDPQDPHRALIPRLHQHGQRAVRVPDHVHQVREGVAVPRDVDALAGQVDDRERDDGVVGAGTRVANRTRRRSRIDRPGDVPDVDGAFVDASDREPVPFRRPPVAAQTLHLLCRDELREAPGHVGVGIGRHSCRRAVIPTARSAPIHTRCAARSGPGGIEDRPRMSRGGRLRSPDPPREVHRPSRTPRSTPRDRWRSRSRP